MKKAKEFLWFLIPFLATLIVTFLYSLIKTHSYGVEFAGPLRYILLFLSDKTLMKALVNTYLANIGCSLVGVGIFAIICKAISKKRNVSKKFFYIASMPIAAVFNFLMLIISIGYDIVSSDTYPAHTIVETAPPNVWQLIDGFDIISSVKFGIIAVFLFWLIETVIGTIKRKNKVTE